MSKLQWKMNSVIGHIYLVASDQGLELVAWDKQAESMAKDLKSRDATTKILAKTVQQLDQYFQGKRKHFELPLVQEQGTDFQKQVWRQLSKIPYGKTVSYSDVARKIKNPKAVRAVGSANGQNPFSIIVPCHRVIAADGSMGGYGGGLKIKAKLLELEQSA